MQPCVEKVFWEDCREVFRKEAPDLFSAIEAISPDRRLYLYKARYPYGSYIVDSKGEFSLPTATVNSMPISSAGLPSDVLEDLYYGKMLPLAFVASGMCNFIE